jgi:subfamily B ATP-binding cassette protein MsbA
MSNNTSRKYPLVLSDVKSNPNTSFWRGYSQFWPFLKPYAVIAIVGMLLTIPVGALDAVVASFLKPFMDRVMVSQDKSFAYYVPLFIIGFSLAQGIFLYLSAYVNNYVGNRIAMDVKLKLYKKLINMETSFYNANNSGSVIYRFASDPDLATSGLINNIRLFLTKFFSSLSLVVVLVYNSWQLSIVAVGVLFLLFIPMQIVRKRVKQIVNRTVGANAKVMTLYNETSQGNREIKSFNLKSQMVKHFNETMTYLFRLNMKIVRDTNWLAPVMHLITACGVAGVLYFGLHLIMIGEITSGGFVAFLAALIMLYTPIKSIGNNYISVQQALLALDRIYQLLKEHSYENEDDSAKSKLLDIKEEINFKDVRFSYTDEREILKGVNFRVEVGTKVALVGNSGGGKTTVCSLIPRLYEIDSGVISIDGHDITEFSLDSLRSKVAMVFQDNFLFEGTIRQNLMYGRMDATEEEMNHAIKSAYLDDFVYNLPHGLDTLIGERGLLLSGGQKQRLAIARAILKNAPLVILDEATSALDNKSEKVVQKALDKLMEGRTTIVIAHRLSTVMDADKILVINDGHIVEEGTHQELLDLNGAYAMLYNSQFNKTHNLNA